jgi:hypothetical protein
LDRRFKPGCQRGAYGKADSLVGGNVDVVEST